MNNNKLWSDLNKIFIEIAKKTVNNLGKGLQSPAAREARPAAVRPESVRPETVRPEEEMERKLLLALLRDVSKKYPQQLKNTDLCALNLKQLKQLAGKASSHLKADLCLREAEDLFAKNLHQNMLRSTGLLGALNNMLQAAQNEEPVRWDVCASQFGSQMAAMVQLERACVRPSPVPANVEGLSVKELDRIVRRQLAELNYEPATTDYLPIYQELKAIPLSSSGDLEEWYRNAAFLLQKGLDRVSPELCEALFVEFPEFRLPF